MGSIGQTLGCGGKYYGVVSIGQISVLKCTIFPLGVLCLFLFICNYEQIAEQRMWHLFCNCRNFMR